MDHYKGFRGFYFRGLSSSLLAHAHINMQLYLHTVSLESIILNTPTSHTFSWVQIFAVQAQSAKTAKIYTLEIYLLYGIPVDVMRMRAHSPCVRK